VRKASVPRFSLSLFFSLLACFCRRLSRLVSSLDCIQMKSERESESEIDPAITGSNCVQGFLPSMEAIESLAFFL
jgi:hypothetical protein